MKTQANDLLQHLKRGLASCYFVFGDEPLQQSESLDAIRREAITQGYTEREVFQITPNFEWAALSSSINTPSLFGDKRLIECRIGEGKVGKGIADILSKLAALFLSNKKNDKLVLFLISAGKLDTKIQQSKGFAELEKNGVTICARPLSTRDALLWIEKRLGAAGFKTTPEISQFLFERTEGNLLAASQVVEKLNLCVDPSMLSLEAIRNIIGMDARFTIYDLVDAALSGNVARTSRIFSSLKDEGEDAILVLWAITREVRTILGLFAKMQSQPLSSTLLSEQGIWKHRETLVRNFVIRFSATDLQNILLKSKHVDDRLKGRALGSPWDLLLSICLTLTGAYHEHA